MTHPDSKPTTGKKRGWGRKILKGFLYLLVLLVIASGVLVAAAWTAAGSKPAGDRLARISKSAHFKDGQFFNALPEYTNYWGALTAMFSGSDETNPKDAVPIAAPTDLTVAPASGLRITWFGHSSMLIEIDGRRFLTDPVWGERASPFSFLGSKRFYPPVRALKDLLPLDAVVLSHDHYDHLDEPSIRALNDLGVPFITPLGIGSHLEYWGVDPARITELDWWQTRQIGGVEVACTPSRHFSGRFLTDRNATLWASWAFVGPDHRAYFSGDTAMFPGFTEIGAKYGPFDVTMMESGAYHRHWPDVHLGPEQAVDAHLAVKGRVLMPVHWGMFNLAAHAWTEPVERVLVAAKARQVTTYVPKPGESFEPTRLPAQTRWWPDTQWETATEHPVVSTGLSN
jgi:L-ascorbate metabolism protein UlaG (beta-lactamase superfamily)